jgi:hypothetical protein
MRLPDNMRKKMANAKFQLAAVALFLLIGTGVFFAVRGWVRQDLQDKTDKYADCRLRITADRGFASMSEAEQARNLKMCDSLYPRTLTR